MTDITEVQGSVIANLVAKHPYLLDVVDKILAPLPDHERGKVYQNIIAQPTDGYASITTTTVDTNIINVLSSDQILTTKWPDPIWAVPGLLPVGLTILAGAPKVGKSWLSLQIAKAIATGGEFLGQKVKEGPSLILALEDTPQRLQKRMNAMKWPLELKVDFLTIPRAGEQRWTMLNGGGEKLAMLIEQKRYRLVVIDTLSRAISGDQQDVQAMTRALTPLHEMANQLNCALLVNDHHRKAGAASSDVIADILGSTAKGAMTDTVWSLYRERGKNGAKLSVISREFEEQTFQIEFNRDLCIWQVIGKSTGLNLTDRRQEILDALSQLGIASLKDIQKLVGQADGHLHNRLQDLVTAGIVKRIKQSGRVLYALVDTPVIDVTNCNSDPDREDE